MISKHHIEQEIKLTASDPSALDSLLDCQLVQAVLKDPKHKPESWQLVASYYDTADWALGELRWSLRTRFGGKHPVCTLKRNSKIVDGVLNCDELEQKTTSKFTRVSDIPAGKIAQAILSILPGETELISRVEVSMWRRIQLLKIGETQLELVADAGHIMANGKRHQLFEVELELLNGDLHATETQAFVKAITSRFNLVKSRHSKHQIGLSLF